MEKRTISLLVLALALFVYYKWQIEMPRLKTDGPYRLKYVEKIYGNAQKSEAVPMVIVLHGSGWNEKSLLPIFEKMNLKMRVISLRGQIHNVIGFEWWDQFAESQEAYNQMTEIKSEEVAQSITGAIARLIEKYPTKGKPLLYGFSRGGQIAFYMALHYPQYFQGALIGSGDLSANLFPFRISKAIPVYAFHGRKDGLIGFQSAQKAVAKTNKLKGVAFLKLYDADHEVTSEMTKDMRLTLSCHMGNLSACDLVKGLFE